MDKAAYQTDKAMKEMKRQAEMVGAAIGAMAVVGAGALVIMVKSSLDAMDQMGKMSAVAGSSVDSFSRLTFAAQRHGVAAEKLSDIYKDVQDKVGDFLQTGGGGMADFFENIAPKVGVTADQFARLSGPEALQLYYTSLEKANLSQSELTFYLEAIASDSAKLIPLLKNGGAGFKGMADEADRLGVTLSESASKQAAHFKDTMAQLELQQTAFSNTVTTAVLPVLQAIADKMLDSAGNADKFSLAGTAVRTVLQTLTVLAAEVAFVFGRVGNTIGGTAAQLERLAHLDFKGVGAINDMIKADDAQAAKDHQAFLDSIMNPPTIDTIGGGRGIVNPAPVKPNAPRLAGKASGKGKDLDADFNAYLKNLQGQIDKTQELTTVETLLAEIRKGNLTVGTKQQQQLTALADIIDKEKEAIVVMNLKRDAAIAAGDAITKSNTEYQALLSRLLDATPSANLARQRGDVRLLTDEFEAGRLSESLYLETVSARLDLTGEKIGQTKSAAEELGLTFSSAFEDAIVGGKAFSDVLDGLIQDMARMAIRKAVTEPMANYMSAAIGTILPSFAVGTEYVPTDMIAQIHQGERIVPAAQNRAGADGRAVTVVQNFTVGDVASISMVRQAVAGSEKRIAGAMGRSMQYGGALS